MLCYAKMAPPRKFDVNELIVEVERIQQARKLTEEENQKLFILNFVKNTFDMNTFSAFVYKPIQTVHIKKEIEKFVYYKGGWSKQLSKEKINKIKQSQIMLLKILKKDSISWGWVQKVLGNRKESKSILIKLFQDQYKLTMNMKIAHYGFHGAGPLGYSEYTLKYLLDVSTKKEQSKLKEQLRKMKVHISKIPQSRKVT